MPLAPADIATFTLEEYEGLLTNVLSAKVVNKDEPIFMNQIRSPLVQAMIKRAPKDMGDPVDGGYKVVLQGDYNQRWHWWSGADLLPFESHNPMTSITAYVGMGHFGQSELIDLLQRQGIRIDMNAHGIKEMGSRAPKAEVLYNILAAKVKGGDYARGYDLSLRFLSANTDAPLCFVGLQGLLSFSSNNTGYLHDRVRTDPMFQHRLITGSAADTLLEDIHRMMYWTGRTTPGGANTADRLIACGETAWELLMSIYLSSSGGAGMLNSVQGMAFARAARVIKFEPGEQFNVTLPQDCLSVDGVPIYRDPMFDDLAALEPTVNWKKAIVFVNTRFLYPIQPVSDTLVPHAMPANRRILLQSWHTEATLLCTHAPSQGVIVVA